MATGGVLRQCLRLVIPTAKHNVKLICTKRRERVIICLIHGWRCALVPSAIVWSARNALGWGAGSAVMRSRVCRPGRPIWFHSLRELTVTSNFTPNRRWVAVAGQWLNFFFFFSNTSFYCCCNYLGWRRHSYLRWSNPRRWTIAARFGCESIKSCHLPRCGGNKTSPVSFFGHRLFRVCSDGVQISRHSRTAFYRIQQSRRPSRTG